MPIQRSQWLRLYKEGFKNWLDLRALPSPPVDAKRCPSPSFTGHPMHGAGRGSDYYDEDYESLNQAGRLRQRDRDRSNNDWMTHSFSQQQPLAQWIQDRQKAFAEFSNSLLHPTPTVLEQDYWPRPPSLEWTTSSRPKMLASNTAELSPKAKVSYDEGQFVVEIPLKDYRVSCLFVNICLGGAAKKH